MAEEFGSIQGRVLTPDARPVADASVLIAEGAGAFPDIAALTDDDGRFGFDDLPPGEYTILVNVEGHDPFTAEFTVQPGESEPQDIFLPP
jgi:hypothetical protein